MKNNDLPVAMVLIQMKLDQAQDQEQRRLLTEVYEKLCRDLMEEVTI